MSRELLRMSRRIPIIALAALGVSTFSIARGQTAAPAEPQAAKPTIYLLDGGYIAGSLCDSPKPNELLWKGDAFAAQLSFAPWNISAVRWPSPKALVKPKGEFAFETAGGDLLFGSLVRMTDKDVELDVSPVGAIHLDRSKLKRFSLLQPGGELLYVGPNGLSEWKAPSANGWKEEGGDLVSIVGGSSIFADLGVPAVAAIELEVSWSMKPSFVLAFGTGQERESTRESFRLEVVDGKLTAVIETNSDADLAGFQTVDNKPGRAHLLLFLDSTNGRYFVLTPEGRKLASLQVSARTAKPPGGVWLGNALGDVRIERLRISTWNGILPTELGDGTTKIIRRDDSVVAGEKVTFDAATKELVVTSGKTDTRIKLDQVKSAQFAVPTVESKSPAIRFTAADGTRVSGTLQKVADAKVSIAVAGIKETIVLPIAALRNLNPINYEWPDVKVEQTVGTLEADGVQIKGTLLPGTGSAKEACLVWRPLGSSSSSPLQPGVSGRIVYREVKNPTATEAIQQPGAVRRVVVQGVVRAGQPAQYTTPPIIDRGKKQLHLRTGDMIVADILKIDEEGVWFKSSSSEKSFVSHDKVKAVELGPDVTRTITLNRSKYDRLLTLPRMQKDSPPTQLLRSTNGDYLRGRVVAMNDKTLSFEVRLETREIPRERVARITWLHGDELDPTKLPPAPAAPSGQIRVQAIGKENMRLTFFAEKFADRKLSGKSEVFGECNVQNNEIDQLLIGSRIEQEAAKLATQQWKLHNAPEPKYVQGGESDAGTESDLVGKPAPDFTLNLLGDGDKRIHLADTKGSVVILDFWATWCGPCLQAMPQVDGVAEEFKDRGVILFAVNLQEGPDKINALLKRINLHPTVALDRDGAVAGKYKAVAIPQTVVIDREGKVARVFVGSSPDLKERLHEAVDSLLKAK